MAKLQGETILQKNMVSYLMRKGITCWVNKNSATYDSRKKVFRKNNTKKGISDILGLLKTSGKMIAIEVKMPKKYATPDQKAFLKDINDNGGIGFIARTNEDLDHHLGEFYHSAHSKTITHRTS